MPSLYCKTLSSLANIVDTKSMVLHMINVYLQTPRKSTSERTTNKEETKVASAKQSKQENNGQITTKKVTSNGDMSDTDKPMKKKTSVGKRSSGDAAGPVFPANMVKVSLSNRRLTDATVSWASLPSSIGKLGKVQFCSILVHIQHFPLLKLENLCFHLISLILG